MKNLRLFIIAVILYSVKIHIHLFSYNTYNFFIVPAIVFLDYSYIFATKALRY
jgi:hypothetical protein